MAKRKLDLTGNIYGKLTVLNEVNPKNHKRRYLCECSCGKQKTVYQVNLRSGATTSCGCYNKEANSANKKLELEGQRFGNLTAIEREGIGGHKIYMWRCICDCGETTSVRGDRLIRGTTKSCGCLQDKTCERVQAFNKENSFNQGVYVPALTRKIGTNNTTGVKGVTTVKRKYGTKYVAIITVKYKSIYLGTFDTLEEATAARQQGEIKYHDPYKLKKE